LIILFHQIYFTSTVINLRNALDSTSLNELRKWIKLEPILPMPDTKKVYDFIGSFIPVDRSPFCFGEKFTGEILLTKSFD
jgi:hypothetical protein